MDDTLILASGSPRRRELLTKAGIPFEAHPTDADETTDAPAGEAVRILAGRKARACAKLFPSRRVLAADTLVSLDERALGKPADENEAFQMLRSLSGRSHVVYTGVCLMKGERVLTGVCASRVRFRELTDSEILDYIATGEPMDKAGAYAIQGGAAPFIEGFEGEYDNIMGLPVKLVRELLERL